jgi:hypothetical protein
LVAATKDWRLSDLARAALRQWQELKAAAQNAGRSISDQLADELRRTPGGENLLTIGHEHDLARCAQIDTLSVVPHFNPTTGRITLP